MTITITITFTITIGEMGPGNHHLTIVAKCHTDLTDIFCNRVILKWKTGDSYLFVCVVGDPVGALRRDCYTLKIFECTYVHQFKHHHHGQLANWSSIFIVITIISILINPSTCHFEVLFLIQLRFTIGVPCKLKSFVLCKEEMN